MNSGKSRWAWAGIASFTLASVLVGGCGSGTPGEPAGSESGAAASGSSSEGGTTIEFWHRTFTPVENEWYKNIVQKFNEAQDEITVVDTEVPADAWDQKMKSAQAANKSPDIYTFAGPLNDGVNAAQFHDLDSIVSKEGLDKMTDLARSVSQIDGTYYAYPLVLEPQTVLFWNEEMVSAAGLDAEQAPKTWQDLLDNCAKIQPTLSDGQYCISPASDAGTFAWASVGQQFNASGHNALTDDWSAPNINDQGYRDLMQFYKDLWDNGYMAKQPLGSYLEAKEFGEKKVAYKVSGSWMMSEVGSDYQDMLTNTGLGLFPSSPNGEGRTTTTLGDFKWVVDAKAKHPEEAGKFLEWVLAGDVENLVPFYVATQFTKIPPRDDVQEGVAATEEAKSAPWSDVIMTEIAPDAIPSVAYPWDVSMAVGTAMETVMKGAATADQAIDTAEKAIQTVIDRESLPEKAPAPGDK